MQKIGFAEALDSIVATDPGDRYLLCSDGLHGYLRSPEEIATIAARGGDSAVDQFIALANQRGGRDNITAVLVEVS